MLNGRHAQVSLVFHFSAASERLEDAGGPMAWSQQETGYDAPLTRLRLHLTADALSDSSWADANKLLKEVLVGLYEVRSHRAEEVKTMPPFTLFRLGLTFLSIPKQCVLLISSDPSFCYTSGDMKRVSLWSLQATGSARRGYRTDQRLPSAHASALKCLLEAEASTEGTDVFKLVKFIIKKEGLYPIGQKVMKESLVS